MQSIHDRHHGWDRTLPPVLAVDPGERVELDVLDAGDGQLDASSAAADVADLDPGRANPVTGPIRVGDARPGDTLAVHVEAVEGSGWGWTANIPGFGLLADDFTEPALIHSRYDRDGVRFGAVARLPHAPFVGTVGVAPAAPGPHDVIPPRGVGGNLDTRDVRPGATLYLPVEVHGALLSIGDTHAVQGDGEVCGTAVETPARVVVRLEVERDRPVAAPHIERPDRLPSAPGPRHVTIGVGSDLLTGARDAVRAMIDVLGRRGVDPVDAYLLCSVAGDLRITEVVNAPNWAVALELPLDVLT